VESGAIFLSLGMSSKVPWSPIGFTSCSERAASLLLAEALMMADAVGFLVNGKNKNAQPKNKSSLIQLPLSDENNHCFEAAIRRGSLQHLELSSKVRGKTGEPTSV
jgi:hypothetical protein